MAVNSFTDPETGKQFWTCLSTDTKPSGFFGALLWETDTDIKYECYGGTDWKSLAVNGAAFVTNVDPANLAHNRYRSGIDTSTRKEVTFDSDENVRAYRVRPRRTAHDIWVTATAFSVGTIVHPTAAVDNAGAPDLVFIVDSISGTGTSGGAEPTWPTVVGQTVVDNSGANQITWKALPADAVYLKVVEDAVNAGEAAGWLAAASDSANTDVQYKTLYDGEWSEWVELSKDPDDIPLSRLDFLPNADTWEVEVQTR